MNKVMGVQEVSPGYEFVAENPAVPEGYKQTEVGVIPEDWEGALLEKVTTAVASGRSKSNQAYGSYPVYGSTGVIGYSSEPQYEGTAILVARVGANAGKLNKVSGKYGVTDNTIILRFSEAVETGFVWKALELKRLNNLVFGSGQPLITGSQLKALTIAVPPLLEQRAIATALSDVDALLEELDRLIAKKRDIKQAAMQQLLTGETRLPGFEGEWEARRIGDVLEVRHGRSQKEVETKDGEYPIYASGGEIGRANTYLYSKPSVLIGRKGTIDAPRYCDQPFWTVDTLFYTELLDRNSAKFMYYKFCMIPWRNYNEASGVPSLSARTIENIEIVLPTHEEQEAIAAVLSDMDTEIQALEQRRNKTAELKQGMMQELLTGRTRLV